jgi:hypothetical protein
MARRLSTRRALPGWTAVGFATLLALAGCAQVDAPDAAATAVAFASAEPDRACALLAPDTAETLSAHAGGCPAALADLALPHPGTAAGVAVEVAGESAQVQLPGQVLFLARFPRGWLVTAAGCLRPDPDPDPAVPYECEVEP